MKKILCASLFCLAATLAFAGHQSGSPDETAGKERETIGYPESETRVPASVETETPFIQSLIGLEAYQIIFPSGNVGEPNQSPLPKDDATF